MVAYAREPYDASFSNWTATVLPTSVATHIAEVELLTYCVISIDDALDLDEENVREANHDHMDYAGLSENTRERLRLTRRLLQRRIATELEALHAASVAAAVLST